MAANSICTIEGCGKGGKLVRGWCNAHYLRWYKRGDPLKTLSQGTPRGEALRYFREVVMTYEGDECLTWPYQRCSRGYGMLNGNGAYRRACEEVNGPPPTPEHQAAHSCGKGHLGCVAKRHVSWKTPKENSADKIIHGTIVRGERSGSAVITEADARKILALKGIETQSKIGLQFGISASAVGNIHRKDNWGWLSV